MDRREFIKKCITGVGGIALAQAGLFGVSCARANGTGGGGALDGAVLDAVTQLGNTGLTVPVMAMGTGTIGRSGASNQTRLGMEEFKKLARNAYDRGMPFYDMAEAYGSHLFVGESIKGLPREKLTLLTKIASTKGLSAESTRSKIDYFRRDVGVDYFDIILMHYITSGGWDVDRGGAMEGLARAKEDGLVKAVGISAHSLDAIRDAAVSPWVDVILTRINPFQSNMDGTPDEIKEALGQARANGKGVLGMKIFGEGTRVKEDEREQSLRFALTESNIHAMTLGFESTEQMDDAVARVVRIRKEIAGGMLEPALFAA